jgi:hypothetical protein
MELYYGYIGLESGRLELKIWIQTLQKIPKKYHNVENVVFYECVIF